MNGQQTQGDDGDGGYNNASSDSASDLELPIYVMVPAPARASGIPLSVPLNLTIDASAGASGVTPVGVPLPSGEVTSASDIDTPPPEASGVAPVGVPLPSAGGNLSRPPLSGLGVSRVLVIRPDFVLPNDFSAQMGMLRRHIDATPIIPGEPEGQHNHRGPGESEDGLVTIGPCPCLKLREE